eukprot:2886924-Pyramimonas_sp.AAC.1
MVKEVGSGHTALRTVVEFIAGLQAGRASMMFGFVPTQRGNLQITTASQINPKVHLALQFLIRNYFRLENVIAVRLAKSVRKLPACDPATGSTLIYYDNDVTPAFRYYKSTGTAIDVHRGTGSNHARIIQCLTSTKKIGGFDEDLSKFEDLADRGGGSGQPQVQQATAPPPDIKEGHPTGGRLPTISEETEADLD